MASAPASRPYLSNGQVLSSPPLTARARAFFSSAYQFIGLYIITLFSLNAQAAAESSSFNGKSRGYKTPGAFRGGWGGSGGGGGGGGKGDGPGGGGGGGPGKRIGRVDDVRGPECKSCQS